MNTVFYSFIVLILAILCYGPNKSSDSKYPDLHLRFNDPSQLEIIYTVEKTKVWEMSCTSFDQKGDNEPFCNSYEECGFSHRLNSTFTACNINKEKPSVDCELGDYKCTDMDCGWKENEKFKDVRKAKCRAYFYDKDINFTWTKATDVVLSVQGSTQLFQLHLKLKNESDNHAAQEDGSTASQNKPVSCDGLCIALIIGFVISIALNVVLIVQKCNSMCNPRNQGRKRQDGQDNHDLQQLSPSEAAPPVESPQGTSPKRTPRRSQRLQHHADS
ncbi:hypothetical protein MHYP_G00201910 [Metynnis hypsauchen]